MSRPKGSLNKYHKPLKISICKQCGIEIGDKLSITRSFCSTSCKATYQRKHLIGKNNPNWKVDKVFRPSVPHSLRAKIKARDVFCQHCGSNKRLQVHHRDDNPYNDDPNNLILLCAECHAKEHILKGDNAHAKLLLSNRRYHHISACPCQICHEFFIPKRNSQVCCSAECARKLRALKQIGKIPWNKGINRVILNCHTCGRQFERRQGNIQSQLAFCSRSCQIDYFSHCHA